MAKVTIVVHALVRKVFTGGILCIFEYAQGLTERGHEVTVVSLYPSEDPEWFPYKFRILHASPMRGQRLRRKIFVPRKRTPKSAIRSWMIDLMHPLTRHGTYHHSLSYRLNALSTVRLPADVTIATHFATALPVAFYGMGRKFYFMQHFEKLIAGEFEFSHEALTEADMSYRLGLTMIANSSWLRDQVARNYGITPELSTNAIDHRIFYKKELFPRDGSQPFTVVSYGGRNAEWKGFLEAAKAIRIVRQKYPDLVWKVYGGSVLAPDNEIAPFQGCGFVAGESLADLYRSSHATLCPSWYESFPLFPLEAMACGSAVVTTPFGVEDYAFDNKTAKLVEAKNPESIAAGLLALIENEPLRRSVVQNGITEAQKHNWERSVATFESIILGGGSWEPGGSVPAVRLS